MGQPVWEGYGLSESASVVTSALRTAKPHHGSVGRPLAGIELRVVGPDGRDVERRRRARQTADDAEPRSCTTRWTSSPTCPMPARSAGS